MSSESVRANQGETNPARIAHVPALSPSHARADEWDRSQWCETCGLTFELDPFHFDCPHIDPGTWGPLAADAITAELVACTLGQRRHADRLELRVDLTGRVLDSLRSAFGRLTLT